MIRLAAVILFVALFGVGALFNPAVALFAPFVCFGLGMLCGATAAAKDIRGDGNGSQNGRSE